VGRDDVAATLEARHELGDRMEPEVIDAFLDRVEHGIAERIDQRVDERVRGVRGLGSRARRGEGIARIAASLALGIPLTAISAAITGPVGLVAVWGGIVALNVYYTESEKRG
jgi:hypothetical protein